MGILRGSIRFAEQVVVMKNNAPGTKLLLILVCLGVVAYFGIQIVLYYHDPFSTTVAYGYTVEETLEISGYVVRDEQVLSEGGELLRVQRAEGERVSVGGTIATVYANQEALDRQEQIDALNLRLEQLDYATTANIGAEASVKLDSQITEALIALNANIRASRLALADDQIARVKSLVLKRDYTYIDPGDLAAQIAQLQKERRTLMEKNQSGETVHMITAPVSGLYSSAVDGYEEILRPDMLYTLTPASIQNLTPQEVSHTVGKLICGDNWYFVATMYADDVENLRTQKEVKLRFDKGKGRTLKVKIDSVSAESSGRVSVVFRGSTFLSELTLLRHQNAQIILKTCEGIRIPRSALRAEKVTLDKTTGQRSAKQVTGVYCVVGAEAAFKPVNVLYNGDGFVLVSSAGTTERERLRSGDEVITTANDLYEDKVIGIA